MPRVGIGIIGTGNIAETHARAYKLVGNAELIGVCDVIEERAEKFANEFGAKKYTDYKSMLENKDIDAVDVCTPNYLHAPISIDAMNS